MDNRPDFKAKATLIQAWKAGVDCVGGERVVAAVLGEDRAQGAAITHLLAVGKAAAAMCAGALAFCADDARALVVTKRGHGDAKLAADARIAVIEAGHPTPDAASLRAGREMAAFVRAVPPRAELVMLVSGGASALAEDLPDAITLTDWRRLNDVLLAGGYDIERINAVRTQLSRIKGGRLLGAFRGRAVRVYAISDVPGDRIEVIGSGIGALASMELSVESSTESSTKSSLDSLPPEARELFARVKSDDSHNDNSRAAESFDYDARIIASNRIARDGAAAFLRDANWDVVTNDESLHCDLHTAAQRIAAEVIAGPPGAYIWGGEPTVVLPRKPGVGGRSQSLALALAKEIRGRRGIAALVAGTDGTDGPTTAAGALIDGDTFDAASGAARALQRADAGTYLARIAALFKPGPTGTNVMDLAIAIKRDDG